MKKAFSILVVFAAIVAATFAATYQTVDMADYGTTASITNTVTSGETVYTAAAITYDAAAVTNTIAFYVKVDGIQYLLGTSAVTNGKYAYVELNPLGSRLGDVLVITTTQTNVNIRLVK